ncbi:hypothetical protein RA266_28830, partial [Pseudomonas syringae pv. tagetis]|uniref:hypothetical protein n=1 Tax=Pseudomonas syringae group genomosp. 7 TaxID=251699 RepID=UPI003770118D
FQGNQCGGGMGCWVGGGVGWCGGWCWGLFWGLGWVILACLFYFFWVCGFFLVCGVCFWVCLFVL